MKSTRCASTRNKSVRPEISLGKVHRRSLSCHPSIDDRRVFLLRWGVKRDTDRPKQRGVGPDWAHFGTVSRDDCWWDG